MRHPISHGLRVLRVRPAARSGAAVVAAALLVALAAAAMADGPVAPLDETAAAGAEARAAEQSAATDEWRAFESEVGQFTVDMPAQPTEKRKEKWFPVSKFVSHIYNAVVGADMFGVNHTDLPRVAMMFASKGHIFDSTRDGFLEDSFAREISYEEITWRGRQARLLQYEIPQPDGKPPILGRAQMFFEGRRLYVFYTEVTRDRSEVDLKRFFDSIRIWPRD